jgi:hypothetical protein
LIVHRLDNLPLCIQQPRHSGGKLPFLVAAWDGQQVQ